jgi:hypothetical protein
MMDVSLVIELLVPGAAYRGSLTANTAEAYDALAWLDERPQPMWEALEAAWTAHLAAEATAARRTQIGSELAEIDTRTVRPARSIAAAREAGETPCPLDVTRLMDLEARAGTLRAELKALGA